MILRTSVHGLLVAAALLGAAAGATRAAEPEFKSSIVTESRIYQRQSSSFSVAGINAGGTTTDVSRVTVALDGVLVTGDWEPKTLESATAREFQRGTDVPAAISRNKLLLQLPDKSVVTAKIVRRERQKPEELAR
jgi:archaellum component FlaF (FlaF/FlaG flagellin family)